MPKKPIFADRAPRSRPGKPPDHPPVKVWETGQIFETYSEAGESVGCTRWGVMRCCKGVRITLMAFTFYTTLMQRDSTIGGTTVTF